LFGCLSRSYWRFATADQLNLAQRRKLLAFVSGSDSVPFNGYRIFGLLRDLLFQRRYDRLLGLESLRLVIQKNGKEFAICRLIINDCGSFRFEGAHNDAVAMKVSIVKLSIIDLSFISKLIVSVAIAERHDLLHWCVLVWFHFQTCNWSNSIGSVIVTRLS
jgi:hypothetical protein